MEKMKRCPSCKKSYVLPRRKLTPESITNLPFLAIPRTLSCLHVVCQSCLDEEWQRSDNCLVICPICSHVEKVESVMDLPLNIIIAKQLQKSAEIDVLHNCSRCYDDVKCFSWCFTCSSGFCEFHHQDHKLSLDTTKHDIYTLLEMKFRNLKPKADLFPLFCPQEPQHSCSMYCHTCKLLVSSQAAVTLHGGHQTTPHLELYDLKIKKRLESIHSDSSARIQRLEGIISDLLADEASLSSAATLSLDLVDKEFGNLLDALKARKKELKQRIDDIVTEKKKAIDNKVAEINDILSNTKRLVQTISALEPSVGADDTAIKGDKNRVHDMYAVALFHSIHTFSSNIKHQVRETSFARPAVPRVSATFDSGELADLKDKISSMGAISTHELRELLRPDETTEQIEPGEGLPVTHHATSSAQADVGLIPDSEDLSTSKQSKMSEAIALVALSDVNNNSASASLHSPPRPPNNATSKSAMLDQEAVLATSSHAHYGSHHNPQNNSHRRHSSATKRRASVTKYHGPAPGGEEGHQRIAFTVRCRSDSKESRNIRNIIIEIRQQTLANPLPVAGGPVKMISVRSGVESSEEVIDSTNLDTSKVKHETIIGQIVVSTEVENTISPSVELRRYFESATYHGVPFFNLVEIVANS